jgi:hypothetical protein
MIFDTFTRRYLPQSFFSEIFGCRTQARRPRIRSNFFFGTDEHVQWTVYQFFFFFLIFIQAWELRGKNINSFLPELLGWNVQWLYCSWYTITLLVHSLIWVDWVKFDGWSSGLPPPTTIHCSYMPSLQTKLNPITTNKSCLLAWSLIRIETAMGSTSHHDKSRDVERRVISTIKW